MAAKKKATTSNEVEETEEIEDTEPQAATVKRSTYLDLQRRHRRANERISELEGMVADLDSRLTQIESQLSALASWLATKLS